MPGGPVVRILLPLQGTQVRPLVGELRFYKLRGRGQKEKKKKKNADLPTSQVISRASPI